MLYRIFSNRRIVFSMPQFPTTPTARWLFAGLMACAMTNVAAADVITFSGAITQSTSDGSGPAVNNSGLNNIQDGDAFTVTLDFLGSIGAPGTYLLSPFSLLFHDSTASVDESSFDSVSVSVLTDGSFFDISMLGCLTTGSGCTLGNELTANFQIPAASLQMQNVAATGLDPPHPLDLLEDDGITDIHGSVTTYSYSGVATVPEPAMLWPLCFSLALLAGRRLREHAVSGGGLR